MITPAPPRKHHYIPAFYLRRWATVDGKLTQFSKPYKSIVTKPISAEGTGFLEGLYELKGFEPQLAQQIEEDFFKPVDTAASRSLSMLERYGHSAPWDADSRSAWTRFILSLLLRCPEDIENFRAWYHADFPKTDEEAEARYIASRSEKDPTTFSEYLETQPLAIKEKYQFETFMSLVDHASVGKTINNMIWRVLPMPENAPSLLTSDRPVVRTNGINGPDGHITLPIGPKLLFIAASDKDFLSRLLRADRRGIAKENNRLVVEGAQRFVYSTDANQLQFVKNRFGRQAQPRLIDQIIRLRMAGS